MRNIIVIAVLMLMAGMANAQIDSTLLVDSTPDSAASQMNMDAVYNRPFNSNNRLPVSLGGYMEVNWQHLGSNGVSDGHQFQFRRMTLFVASSLGKKLKFLSEIEIEDGGKELALEFAAVDLTVAPMLNFRGGVILNPIGAFNQNHDGPKWEFTDRPISATQMLPATWSNAGFGVFGKRYINEWSFGYEAYVSGNFDNSIVDNGENRTFLPTAKNNPDRFEEINSGLPLVTTKVAVKREGIGELGLSYMGGVYNKFQDDGLVIDEKRRLDVFAIDFNATFFKDKLNVVGEWAVVNVDVPSTYTQQYGGVQHGGYLDWVWKVKEGVHIWKDATINLALRLEYVDWNVGKFNETNDDIGDATTNFMPGISFRPTSGTVFRLNYKNQEQIDLLNNALGYTRGFIFGVSSYF